MRVARRKFLARLREPDRVKVCFDEITIGKLDRRRTDIAIHHPLGPLEVILIVWTLGRAIAYDERCMSRASRATRTLHIIGGRWRHIAEIDRVQSRNID